MKAFPKTYFASQLYIQSGIADIRFYGKAFGAVERRRFINEDGSIHVAELSFDGALFDLQEQNIAWTRRASINKRLPKSEISFRTCF
jgi:hypothetical protein